MYEVRLTPKAERQLRALPENIQRRCGKRIDALARTPRPRGAKKLKGVDDAYRIRVGEYRIVYIVKDDELIVLLITVGHRRAVYGKLLG